MKRTEMVQYITKLLATYDDCALDSTTANEILEGLEQLGMVAPRLPSDHCQAIMDVYYGGYTFHQWEEDAEKDKKVMAALAKRKERASLTPEERKTRRMEMARRRRSL